MTVVTAHQRDRLAEIRARSAKAREAMANARRAQTAAHQAREPQAEAAATLALESARGDLLVAQELESQALSQIAGLNSYTATDSLFDDVATVQTLEQLAGSSMPIGSMALGPAVGAADLVAMIESGSWGPSRMAVTSPSVPDSSRTSYYGVIEQPRRRLSLLDLIPTMQVDSLVVEYMQEGAAVSGSPSSFDTAVETAEGAIKPQADLNLGEAQAIVRTIAHWVKLKRQQIADVPALETLVRTRLTYGVLRRVESQILSGNGVGENITGIVGTTGVGDVQYDAGELAADQALEGVVDVLLSEAVPNAVILNPRDWADLRKAKADGTGQSGAYYSAGPFVSTAQQLWDCAVIPSTAVAAGTALVGDFSSGCTLLVREGVNIRLSDSDADDFTRNRVTVLGEGRFGLMIQQPGAFAVVHLTA